MLNVINALQASIAPVTLISGVGFLSLVMSNRFGRVIDRLRALLRQIHLSQDDQIKKMLKQEVSALYKRANHLRIAAVLGGASIFCTALTIFLIFANLMFDLPLDLAVEIAFVLSLVCLLFFALIFIYDFGITLRAVNFEMIQHLEQPLDARVAIELLPNSEEP
jgi:hypothetical protein